MASNSLSTGVSSESGKSSAEGKQSLGLYSSSIAGKRVEVILSIFLILAQKPGLYELGFQHRLSENPGFLGRGKKKQLDKVVKLLRNLDSQEQRKSLFFVY